MNKPAIFFSQNVLLCKINSDLYYAKSLGISVAKSWLLSGWDPCLLKSIWNHAGKCLPQEEVYRSVLITFKLIFSIIFVKSLHIRRVESTAYWLLKDCFWNSTDLGKLLKWTNNCEFNTGKGEEEKLGCSRGGSSCARAAIPHVIN